MSKLIKNKNPEEQKYLLLNSWQWIFTKYFINEFFWFHFLARLIWPHYDSSCPGDLLWISQQIFHLISFSRSISIFFFVLLLMLFREKQIHYSRTNYILAVFLFLTKHFQVNGKTILHIALNEWDFQFFSDWFQYCFLLIRYAFRALIYPTYRDKFKHILCL
jgi:hypothetical protein